MVTKEVNQITKYKRMKRGFWLGLLKTAVMDVLICAGVIAVAEYSHQSKVDEMQNNLIETQNRVVKLLNISVLQNGIIETLAMNQAKLQDDVENLTAIKKKTDLFHNLMGIATQSLMTHHKETSNTSQ